MTLRFDDAEHARRAALLSSALEERGLDALLVFSQETSLWLTGYDTFGYCFLQCLVVPARGAPTLLTRAPDRLQALRTSNVRDVRVWEDRAGADPARELVDLLRGLGLARARLGVEWDSHGLTGASALALADALRAAGARAEDASGIAPALRLAKSPAELELVRGAARLADAAELASVRAVRAGASEAEVASEMQCAVLRGGGDLAGNPFVVGAGPDALLCRSRPPARVLGPDDQITLEYAGVLRRYHACRMRTLATGRGRPRSAEMRAACRRALAAAEAELRPGSPLGRVFEAHADALDSAGLRAARMNACGYALGAVYPPSWMDRPMVFRGSAQEPPVGSVFFLHMIAFDEGSETAMTLGETYLVGEKGAERLRSLDFDPLEPPGGGDLSARA